ncbi:YciE/YciF ferroxidase family protein [Muricoccus vinaceus]|uniref:Ferritin-like domain-containing protein n=1 Tax=Muricoccus vinaceus TaxID=424704 RepID=A0ABV6IYP8_9PROT
MAKEKTLADAFHETLKDIYYAERQSVRSLKKLAKAASDLELKQAFEKHGRESAAQLDRLEQVFESIGKKPQSKTSEAIQGLAAEMEEDMDDFGGTQAADAVLIASVQAIEHYEIARYGALVAWARKLGNLDAAELLNTTLEEEKATDVFLTELAEKLNAEASV